jgi:hypothetical protein
MTWHAANLVVARAEPGLLDPSVRRACFVGPPVRLPTSLAPETPQPPCSVLAPAAEPELDVPELPAYLPGPGEEAEAPPTRRKYGEDKAPAMPPPAPPVPEAMEDWGGPPAPAAQPKPPPETSWHSSIEPALFPGATCEGGPCAGLSATPGRLEVSGGYLLWWTRGSRLPPLVTTAPAGAPARGTLGAPGTVLLFGDQDADELARSGGQLQATYWIDPLQTLGVTAGGFVLGRASTDFAADSDAHPILARPVFLADRGAEGRQLLATPGDLPGEALRLRGQVEAKAVSRLWGADVGLRGSLVEDAGWRVDLVTGFRYLDLAEDLHLTTDTVSLRAVPGVPAFDVGNDFAAADRFDTRNHFYGGQVGLRGDWRLGRWRAEGQAGVALGLNQETVDIDGSRAFTTAAGQRQVQGGGLLALPSNSGRFGQDRFAVVPEVGLKVSYQVTESLSAYVGYDFLYWANVVRPADQVDRGVDARQISGAFSSAPPNLTGQTRPTFAFHESGFWAQGVTAGLEWRY